MAEAEEWSSNSNKAFAIQLIQPGDQGPQITASFHPRFTYPIFGESETIFGYQNLRINLRVASHDLRLSLDTRWERQYRAIGDTSPLDVKATLKDWLPQTAFENPALFDAIIQEEGKAGAKSALNFKPPGDFLTSYKVKEREYEIWQGHLDNLKVQQIFKRIQIFTPLFIEGGTFIDLNDPEWSLKRWTIYFLYEKLAVPPTPNASRYSFIGYSTVYRYFLYAPLTPPSTPPESQQQPPNTPSDFALPLPLVPTTDLPCRERISQFVILPPFQRSGHGRALYSGLVNRFIADPTVHEITVEDPNEAFDDLRDVCDLARLRKDHPLFTAVRIKIPANNRIPRRGRLPTAQLLPQKELAHLRHEAKIAPRQFSRLVEMQLLSLIPSAVRHQNRRYDRIDPNNPDDVQYGAWRLLVKQRVYKFNRDQLVQLDRADRFDKIADAAAAVEAEYIRILALADADAAAAGRRDHAGSAGSHRPSKRKVIPDDEDLDGDQGTDGQPPQKKKMQV
ncbi:MAG: hypothetical protein M1825_001502 [Sarcosagium campestre]|nr:MAG: hypothetical protein M1825_001502 [Sarcosagium campestre]